MSQQRRRFAFWPPLRRPPAEWSRPPAHEASRPQVEPPLEAVSEDLPWDRPAELAWPPSAESSADRLLASIVEATAIRQPALAVGVLAQPVSPIPADHRQLTLDEELDDPYDEFAPLADDLAQPMTSEPPAKAAPALSARRVLPPPPAPPAAPARPVRAVAPSLPVPPAPAPPAEPAAPAHESVFGDLFASSAPAVGSPSAVELPPEHEAAAQEWPPVPAEHLPWESVGPAPNLWSTARADDTVPPLADAWSSTPSGSADRPAKQAAPPTVELPPVWTPELIGPATAATTGRLDDPARPMARASQVAAAVPPLTPFRAARREPTLSYPARPSMTASAAATHAAPLPVTPARGPSAVASAEAGEEADGEVGPSTLTTLLWTVLTGLATVALVLVLLHFLTGAFG